MNSTIIGDLSEAHRNGHSLEHIPIRSLSSKSKLMLTQRAKQFLDLVPPAAYMG